MTEEKKLRFLMRGVKQELFAGFVRNPPSQTVSEFISEATTMERTLDGRSRQYDRQSNSVFVPNVDAIGVTSGTLRATIRVIVSEELRKLFPTTPLPQVVTIMDVIREEVQQALGTSSSPATPREPEAMTYVIAVRLSTLPPQVGVRRPRRIAVKRRQPAPYAKKTLPEKDR